MKSKKRKQDTFVPTPRSYSEMKSLCLKDLKYLCKDAGIKIDGISRDALEILLCDAIGISSTGSKKVGRETKFPRVDDHCLDDKELSEFDKFSPSYVQSLQGWTTNTANIPDIDIGTVKKYLLSSNNPEFSKETLRKYKLSRSYAHLEAKHIHSVMFNELKESDTFCIVKGQCLPSQSGDAKRVKWLHVILDKKTGEPYGAFCICTVGRGQACSHIGSLLFLLSEVVASGTENLPPDQSCTDVLCSWSEPKGASVVPKLVEEVIQHEKVKPTVKDYSLQVSAPLSDEQNYQRALKLIFDIRNANRESSMPPIVNIVDLSRFRTSNLPETPAQTKLPDKCLDFDIPISTEIHVESYPMPVYRFPHLCFPSVNEPGFSKAKNQFIASVRLSEREILDVETLTTGQSQTPEWFEQRKGAITGSKVLRISNFYENGKAKPESIVKDIMQYNFDPELSNKIPALAWGIKNEDRALNIYIKDFAKSHSDVEVMKPGLLVHKQYPYIRVSPDALVSCSCHGNKLVEIKCSHKFRNSDLNDIIAEGKLDYIGTDGTQNYVKKGQARGYFEQILLQQAISGVHNAEMLVWTKCGYVVIPVNYDEAYWSLKLLPRLRNFFTDFIAAEILTSRIKNGKELYSEDVLSGETEHVLDDENPEQVTDIEISVADDSDSESNGNIDTANDSIHGRNNISSENGDDDKVDDDGDDDTDDRWTLGCKLHCKDNRAPTFSKVKGKIIACDSHLVCAPSTWFHFFCEGFKRMPCDNLLKRKYVCRQCREVHPDKENLMASDGFF